MSPLSKEQIENRIRELIDKEGLSLEQLELDSIIPEAEENGVDLKSLFCELGSIRSEFRQLNRTEKKRLDTLKAYFEDERQSKNQLLETVHTLVANSENSQQESILLPLVEIMDFVESFNQGLILLTDSEQRLYRSLLKKLFEQKEFDYIASNLGMLIKKIERLLEKSGVFPITTDGEIFSPLTMVAVEKIEDHSHPDQVVLETMEKGYLLNNKVLRLAKVKVNSHASTAENSESLVEN